MKMNEMMIIRKHEKMKTPAEPFMFQGRWLETDFCLFLLFSILFFQLFLLALTLRSPPLFLCLNSLQKNGCRVFLSVLVKN